MSQFANLEDALNAMSQDIQFKVTQKVNEEVQKKAVKVAKRIDREVAKYFNYLASILPAQRYPTRLSGLGSKWKPLSESWQYRKLKRGIPLPSYFEGVSKFKSHSPVQPLLDYVDDLTTVADRASFLGTTQVYNDIAKAWNPPDARIISWTTQTGRQQSAWFGTSRTGHKGFISRPSDKEFHKVQLRIMPNVLFLGHNFDGATLDTKTTERQLASKIDKFHNGQGQGIKFIGRNRQILAPLLRWMYNQHIAKILREESK